MSAALLHTECPPDSGRAHHHHRRFGAFRAGPPVAVAVGAAATAAVVARNDPSTTGGLVACPVRALTGIWCPGCGLTRATHHLLHGDVVQALSFNAMTPFVLAGLLTLWYVWFRVATGAGVPDRIRRIRVMSYVAAGLILLAFTVVRNIPGGGALRGE